MATEKRIWPDVAIPPGEILAETIQALGISQAELARRAGRPAQAINEIIQGAKEITPETALQFERVLGVPAHVWVRLEADYRFNKACLEDEEHLKAEIPLAREYPYQWMIQKKWIPSVTDMLDVVRSLLRFFAVTSLTLVGDPLAAFRKSPKVKASRHALAAWLRQGNIEAQGIETGKFDARALREALPALRNLTRLEPREFEPKMKELLAQLGIAFVLVPEPPGTGGHGATRWIGQKAVIQMSIRYKWEDIFWFTFFHEIAHILRHGRAEFLELDANGQDAREKEADVFAADTLIPPSLYAGFTGLHQHFSRATVTTFADQLGVSPAIVAGRLKYDKRLPQTHLNDLRRRFEWAPETEAS